MKNFINWIKKSNRWLHFLGGLIIGIISLHWWSGIYAATIAGLVMEYKDKAHGGEYDWVDASLTALGGIIGGLLTLLIC